MEVCSHCLKRVLRPCGGLRGTCAQKSSEETRPGRHGAWRSSPDSAVFVFGSTFPMTCSLAQSVPVAHQHQRNLCDRVRKTIRSFTVSLSLSLSFSPTHWRAQLGGPSEALADGDHVVDRWGRGRCRRQQGHGRRELGMGMAAQGQPLGFSP